MVKEKYCKIIKDYIFNNYKNNFREPVGKIKHPFIVPGSCYSSQLWDWDSWLTGLALMKIEDEKMFYYQSGCVLNFLEHMDKQGRMPILIQEPDTFEIFKLKDDKETNCHKPCIAQHALAICKNFKTIDWIKPYFNQLVKFLGWYEINCFDKESGLYFWIDDFAIGFDNDPTVFYRPNKSTAAIYLNSLMYSELMAMADLAKLLKKEKEQKEYLLKAKNLKSAIQNQCFDSVDGYFYSADISLKKIDKNEWLHSGSPRHWKTLPIKIKTWAGLMPLWNKIATKEQAEYIVKHHLVDLDDINSKFGIRSISKKEKMYKIEKSGNPSCWLGPIWINANYMTYEGLKNYGFDKEAEELASKIINMLGKDLEKNGQFHEYYSPESGEGVHNLGFQSWNFLVLKMIEDLEK